MPESERQRADQQGNLSQATEALRGSLTDWATVRVQADRALVLPAPDLDALYAGLERTLGGDWTVRYAVEQMTPPVVRASLHLGVRVREGVAEGHTLTDARLLALSDALRAYGVQPASNEGQWVEYDPEEGANIHELEPQTPLAPLSGRVGESVAALPPTPPRDPQMERARKHIDDLLEGLKDTGQGKAAALVLARRGYGNTLEESREVYKELKALKG